MIVQQQPKALNEQTFSQIFKTSVIENQVFARDLTYGQLPDTIRHCVVTHVLHKVLPEPDVHTSQAQTTQANFFCILVHLSIHHTMLVAIMQDMTWSQIGRWTMIA